jgi:hypothetical protein
MTDADKERLGVTGDELAQIRHELLDADDARTLTRLHTASHVDSSYSHLATLGSRYDVWPEAPSENPAGISVPQAAMQIVQLEFNSPGALHDASQWIEHAALAVAVAAESVVVVKALRITLDILTFAISIAIGVATGLTAFYSGKTFGTWQDYLTVILVGTSTAALSKTLLDGLTRFWVGDAGAPQVATNPKAASVSAVT